MTSCGRPMPLTSSSSLTIIRRTTAMRSSAKCCPPFRSDSHAVSNTSVMRKTRASFANGIAVSRRRQETSFGLRRRTTRVRRSSSPVSSPFLRMRKSAWRMRTLASATSSITSQSHPSDNFCSDNFRTIPPPPPHTHTTRMKWHSDYVNDGRREILECLAIQNTIPNASGVLFRRAAVLDIPTDSWFRYQGLGDWFAYLHVALNWRIAFCARVLNGHRRHSKSVIARIQERAIREHRMIQEYIARKCDLPRATLDAQRDFIRKLSQP